MYQRSLAGTKRKKPPSLIFTVTSKELLIKQDECETHRYSQLAQLHEAEREAVTHRHSDSNTL